MGAARLKQIAQKAEEVKRKKAAFESVYRKAQEKLALLTKHRIEVPEPDPTVPIREAVRRLDWDEASKLAEALDQTLETVLAQGTENRRTLLGERGDKLFQLGLPLDAESVALYERADEALGRHAWADALGYLESLEGVMAQAQEQQRSELERKIRELVRWSGAEARSAEVLQGLQPCLARALQGDFAGADSCLELQVPERLPEAEARWKELRSECEALCRLAREHGVPTEGLEMRLASSQSLLPLQFVGAAERLAEERAKVEASLRNVFHARVEEYRELLEELKGEGAPVEEFLNALGATSQRLDQAVGPELGPLIQEAIQSLQAPVMGLVAGYFEEIGPLMTEGRRLGRNTIPLVQEMNRSREHLRALQFRPALEAARRALEMASELVADVAGAKEQLEDFRDLVARLSQGGLKEASLQELVGNAEEALREGQLDRVSAYVDEGIREAGRRAVPFLRARLRAEAELLDRLSRRSWPVEPFPTRLRQLHELFEEGKFPETAEGFSRMHRDLRGQMTPFITQRLEEMRQALEKLPGGSDRDEIHRRLAESDLGLKIKEDLELSLGELESAEKGLSEAFARASDQIVEELDRERASLQELGVETDEIKREIQLIRQIFTLGDFLKGSQSSQEVRTRILQQQLVRAEETISRAKLAVVELGKMGLEPEGLRGALTLAGEKVRAGQYREAFREATNIREEAQRIRSTARSVLDVTTGVAETLIALRKAGYPPEELQEFAPQIDEARSAFRALDFEKARALAEGVLQRLERLSARQQGLRELADLEPLLASARRVGIEDPVWEGVLSEVKEGLSGENPTESFDHLKELKENVSETIRGALEEQLHSLEADLRAARAIGMDTVREEGRLRDAYRQLGEPLPVGVVEIIEGLRREFFESKEFQEQERLALGKAHEALEQADLVRAGVKDLKVRLEALDHGGEALQPPERIAQARQLTQEALERTQSQVARTLNNFQSMINRAKMDGALTMVAENLLVQARGLLSSGEPHEALLLAARSESELERVELQHALASNSLLTLESKIDEAEKSSLHVPRAHAELETAKDLLSRGDYAGVLEHTMEGGDMLLAAERARKEAHDLLAQTSRYLDSLEVLGSALDPLREQIAQGQRDLSEGRYPEARRQAESAYDRARSELDGLLSHGRAELEKLRLKARALDPERYARPSGLETAIRAKLEARDWAGALAELSQEESRLKGELRGLLDEERARLEKFWEEEPALSPEESRLREETLTGATQALAEERYDEAGSILERGRTEGASLHRGKLESEFTALEERVLLGERLGVDTTPVMEIFTEAKLDLAAGKNAESQEKRRRSEETLDGLFRQRVPERLQELTSEVAFAREGLGVEVGSLEALLKEVEGSVGAGKFAEAARSLVQVESELNRLKGMHHRLASLRYMIEAALNRRAGSGADVSGLRDRLTSISTSGAGGYDEALQQAQKLLEEARSASG